jgi:hypothetical protein
MVVTLKTTLPSEEDLNIQEVNLSSPVLRAGAFHLGKYCEQQNNVNIIATFCPFYTFGLVYLTAKSFIGFYI